MNKEREYQALISDVKGFYIAQESIHKNDPVYLTWFNDCEEINLWTYWQGHGNLNAKIMLVGQDWGSPADSSDEYIAQFVEINEGKRSSYWLDGTSITDDNLIKLFSSIGYTVSSEAPWNPNLFFTSFVLGYRNKGFSGSFRSRWLIENKDFFSRLANIVEPKVIICLGRNAFRGVMMAFDKKVHIGNYNAFITGESNPVEVSLASGQKVAVFAEAHCGAMGTLNRSRLKAPDGTTGIELQKRDWANIKDYLESVLTTTSQTISPHGADGHSGIKRSRKYRFRSKNRQKVPFPSGKSFSELFGMSRLGVRVTSLGPKRL